MENPVVIPQGQGGDDTAPNRSPTKKPHCCGFGTLQRRNSLDALSGLRLRLPRSIREPKSKILAQGAQALTRTRSLQQAVYLQRGSHHIATQRGIRIGSPLAEPRQPHHSRTQLIERREILDGTGGRQIRRNDLRILCQHPQGLAAERLRLVI
jgi:hypothetical protein